MGKETSVRVGATVCKRAPGVYEAFASMASGAARTSGRGASAKEAKDALAASLAWVAHTDPSFITSGSGRTYLLYPVGAPGNWMARSITRDGTPGGSTLFGAESWSMAKRQIEQW